MSIETETRTCNSVMVGGVARRSVMGRTWLLGSFTLFIAGLAQLHAEPNLVLIMADDMGWSDTSNTRTNQNNASDYYETPTLERLSDEGMSFTNAYTGGATCAPTRAALLTGQYAPRATNNVYAVTSLDRVENSLLVGPAQGLPSGTDAIPTNALTYAEMLQQAGYATAHVGKFHVTETGTAGAALITSDHGFDQNFGGTTIGQPGNYHASGGIFGSGNEIGPEMDAFAGNYTQQYVDDNIKPYADGTSMSAIDALVGTDKHISDAMADAAIQFMEQEKGGNFLVQFHPYAVHTPIGDSQARADLLSKYRAKSPGVQDGNAAFGALLEGLDQSVARLIEYLETTPDPQHTGKTLAENTLVVFYSDNGGRQPQSNNGPLKGEKGILSEGGIRVPLIAWSGNPDLVDAGTVNDTPVTSVDFYKTFAALSSAGDPAGVTLDGMDLSGVLADSNASLDREALFWHYPGYNKHDTQRPQSVVRQGDWKLLYSYEDQSYELYNLVEDLAETTDLAASNSTKLAELGLTLINWLDSLDAPLAKLRTGQLVLDVSGAMYANGEISFHDGPLAINAGEEVPLVLGELLNLADLNLDARVDANDWRIFRSNQGTNLAGMSAMDAFQKGDLDGDFDNDFRDFLLFKHAYNSANGADSFESLLSVPEPHSTMLMISASLTAVSRDLQSNQEARQ